MWHLEHYLDISWMLKLGLIFIEEYWISVLYPALFFSLIVKLWVLSHQNRAGKMYFKVAGPWSNEKYCRPPWLEKFLNSRRSRMAKTITFWPWWQAFNSSCFETLSFFPPFPFFLFSRKKKSWTPSPPLLRALWKR